MRAPLVSGGGSSGRQYPAHPSQTCQVPLLPGMLDGAARVSSATFEPRPSSTYALLCVGRKLLGAEGRSLLHTYHCHRRCTGCRQICRIKPRGCVLICKRW